MLQGCFSSRIGPGQVSEGRVHLRKLVQFGAASVALTALSTSASAESNAAALAAAHSSNPEINSTRPQARRRRDFPNNPMHRANVRAAGSGKGYASNGQAEEVGRRKRRGCGCGSLGAIRENAERRGHGQLPDGRK